MRIRQVVKVYFARRRPDIDQAWLNDRYRFFADHTLRSIRSQTVQDFILWAACDAGMEGMVDGLRAVAPEAVITFGSHLPESLPEKERVRLRVADYVYVTRVDSDDLLAPRALEIVRGVKPAAPDRVEAAIFRMGYMFDMVERRLGVYQNPSSPFHTLMFPAELFCDRVRYDEVFVGDHSKVGGAYHVHVLPPWQFCVLIHGRNFLSTFDYSRTRHAPPVTLEGGWSIDRFLGGEL